MTPATATREGRTLVLRVLLLERGTEAHAAASARAFDGPTASLDWLLAAVSAGAITPVVAAAMLRHTPRLYAEALALLELATPVALRGPAAEVRVTLGGG